jgi:hypothetical protein
MSEVSLASAGLLACLRHRQGDPRMNAMMTWSVVEDEQSISTGADITDVQNEHRLPTARCASVAV